MNRIGFLDKMIEMASPVLDAAADGRLRELMSVEQQPGAGREKYAGLEAVARLINGMAPWLELDEPAERELRQAMLEKARRAINGQVDPSSPDFMDYERYSTPRSQILVDAAFLAQAILRAPSALWDGFAPDVQARVLALMRAAREIEPARSNWLLFSTEVELLWRKLTGERARGIINEYFGVFESWYFGDGWYGDGPNFKHDYYNSLVIHPMLLDICDEAPDLVREGAPDDILKRARRHAEVLENMVAPDGTYIATGRSLAYRCGVFHLLAQLAWQGRLPAKIEPAAAREALCAVTEKTLAPASYRPDGFLNIGICRPQPEHSQSYICTGSLYMAAAVFLPLGLAPDDGFWTGPALPWTQRAVWEGA